MIELIKVSANNMQTTLPDVSDDKIRQIFEGLLAETSAFLAYSSPIDDLLVSKFSNFYALHLAIWQIREQDLQLEFPLRTRAQRAQYLAWCVLHGHREYRALQELDVFWNELLQPADIPHTEWSGGVSRLLQLAVYGRPDLGIDPELKTAKDQERALSWYFLDCGFKELYQWSGGAPSWQRNFFLGRSLIADSKFAHLLYLNRNDIRAAFDISLPAGKHGFNNWLITHGTIETGLRMLVQPAKRAWPEMPSEDGSRAFGVNLIGYAFGELGIGEDVRMAAHALHAADIPFTIINVDPGSTISQNDKSAIQWVGSRPVYMFNVICLTALEHLRVFLDHGKSLFSGRYNIGYWPWELQNWPSAWKHCLNLVDEVWASSAHIERSLKAITELPVRLMPMAVMSHKLSGVKESNRNKFSLPNSKTLFIFSFDGKSYIQRKNPLAIVKAFASAFPSGDEDVCLVIKCMRPDKNSKEWLSILDLASRDTRLIIVDKTLSKLEVLDLYSCCDCFVSLHRAEGFGRGIAEALTLGLEVIATNYGGNVEFCRTAGAKLIPYSLVPVGASNYVEWQGNFWAEPDIAAASAAMRSVHVNVEQPNSAVDLMQRQSQLGKLFSPSAVGERYEAHLRNLARLL